MAPLNDEVMTKLNDVIEIDRDRARGYVTAAENIRNHVVRDQLLAYSRQTSELMAELEQLVRQLGGEPEHSGTAAGALHHGWINIKGAATSGDEGAILSEAERGEDAAMRAYEQALESELPAEAQEVLVRQYSQVKEAHDRIRDLRDQYLHKK